MSALHISIAAEPIIYLGEFAITNSMFTSLVVSGTLIMFALLVRLGLRRTDKPSGLQNFAEWLVETLYNFVHGMTGDHRRTSLFMPFIATFFMFILLNNWLGLLPGVGTLVVPEAEAPVTEDAQTEQVEVVQSRWFAVQASSEEPAAADTSEATDTETSPVEPVSTGHKLVPLFRPGTADLNTTIALALISIIMTQVFGLSYLKLAYLKKFFNFSSPIMFYVGILELISEIAKIISFAFRLFGNIFAGEVLLVVIASIVPIIAPMPFYGLELFVGFIQALVFSMLTLVFFNAATQGHEQH